MALKCITHTSPLIFFYILMSRQAWRLCSEALAVMLGGTASSADLECFLFVFLVRNGIGKWKLKLWKKAWQWMKGSEEERRDS